MLTDFANAKGFRHRELNWKKCSKEEVGRYAEFVKLFWHMHQAVPPIDFRSLVINKNTNPLRHHGFGCDTAEVRFYKFYNHFLTASVRKTAWRGTRFTFRVASTIDNYPHRIKGALRRAVGSKLDRVEILRPEPKECRLHQLTDILLGAVSYRANGRSSFKGHICERIEGYVRAVDSRFLSSRTPIQHLVVGIA